MLFKQINTFLLIALLTDFYLRNPTTVNFGYPPLRTCLQTTGVLNRVGSDDVTTRGLLGFSDSHCIDSRAY